MMEPKVLRNEAYEYNKEAKKKYKRHDTKILKREFKTVRILYHTKFQYLVPFYRRFDNVIKRALIN